MSSLWVLAWVDVHCARCELTRRRTRRRGSAPLVGILATGLGNGRWNLAPWPTQRLPGAMAATEPVAAVLATEQGAVTFARAGQAVDLYCPSCRKSCGAWRADTLAARLPPVQRERTRLFVPEVPGGPAWTAKAAVAYDA